jgi:hypothetical protein
MLLILVGQAILFAQGAAANAVPVSNTGLDALVSQAVISAGAAYAFEGLKKAGWFTWVTPQTSGKVMKLIGAGVAFATALGIHYSFDPTAGIFTITGLTFATAKDHAYDWLRAWILQQSFYDQVIKTKETSNVVQNVATAAGVSTDH